jgi:hypothetical protein
MLKRGHVLVVSPWLVYLIGLSCGAPSRAKAAAVFPFIIVRSQSEVQPWLINHELIHFRQDVECLFVGSWLLSFVETAYAMLVLKKSLNEAYAWRSNEQEAYRNQNNPDYLKIRKPWTRFRYLKDKREFKVGGPSEIIYTKVAEVEPRH